MMKLYSNRQEFITFKTINHPGFDSYNGPYVDARGALTQKTLAPSH
jgi:hypothetical protein